MVGPVGAGGGADHHLALHVQNQVHQHVHHVQEAEVWDYLQG